MSTLPRLEIFTALGCDGGTRLNTGGFVRPVTLVSTESLEGPETLKFSIPVDSEAAPLLNEGQVARVWRSDTSYDEWFIGPINSVRSRKGIVDVVAKSVVYRLSDCALVTDPIGSSSTGAPLLDVGAIALTPREIIQAYLLDNTSVTSVIPWLTMGVIEPTVEIDLHWSSATPAAVLKGLVDAVQATGELCEFRLRRVGSTSYAIDVLHEIGATEKRVSFRVGRNLPSLTRSIDPTARATRIEPVAASLAGAATYLGLARWVITGKNVNVLTLADPAGSAGPVGFDTQLQGWYLWNEALGVSSLITATNATTQAVTVSSASGFAIGQYVEFRTDSGNSQPYYLDHPTYIAATTPGVGVHFKTIDRSDVQGVPNLVPNSVMRTWTNSAALPDGWTAIDVASGTTFPGTYSQNTDPLYTQLGGKSLFLSTSSGTLISPPVKFVTWYDDQRMSMRMRLILTQWNAPGSYLQMSLGIMLADGTVHTWRENTNTILVQPGDRRPAPWTALAGGTFVDIVVNGIDVTVPCDASASNVSSTAPVVQADIDALATTARGFVVTLQISADRVGPPAGEFVEAYIDGVMLTPSAEAPDTLTEFGGANTLWQATNVALGLLAPPQVSYAVDVVDLGRLAAA